MNNNPKSKIENPQCYARLEAALQRSNARLAAFHAIDRALRSATTFQDMACAALPQIQQLIPCAGIQALMIDSSTGEAVVLGEIADGALQRGGARFPLASVQDEPKVEAYADMPALIACARAHAPQATQGPWRWLDLPLTAHDRLLGALVLRMHATHSLDADDIAVVEAVADQIALAIQQARLFEQVRLGRERHQMLSRRLVEIQETERHQIACELHDELGQNLTGLKMMLEAAVNMPPDQIPAHMREAAALVYDLMGRVRELSLSLRPAMLDDVGLLAALIWLFERYTKQTGVQVIFRHALHEQRFAPAIEIGAYRIAQEALTNVARHAAVTEVTVNLWVHQGVLGLLIEDKGCGFAPGPALAANRSVGLTGMRERAALLGGRLMLESTPGQGTCVVAELPLEGRLERRQEDR